MISMSFSFLLHSKMSPKNSASFEINLQHLSKVKSGQEQNGFRVKGSLEPELKCTWPSISALPFTIWVIYGKFFIPFKSQLSYFQKGNVMIYLW